MQFGKPVATEADRRRRYWSQLTNDALETNARLGRTPSTPKELHHAVVGEGLSISLQAVYLWLSGDTAPSVENQAVVARVIGVPHHMLYPVEIPRVVA